MDVNRIANRARKSISTFCIEECKAYCCRKGHLVVKENEINKVTQDRKNELIAEGKLKPIIGGKYSLYIGDEDNACPSLKGNKCLIHKSRLRPKTCGDFPIYIVDKTVMISGSCTAARAGMFYPYIKKFMKLGYKVSEGSGLLNSDFYKVAE